MSNYVIISVLNVSLMPFFAGFAVRCKFYGMATIFICIFLVNLAMLCLYILRGI